MACISINTQKDKSWTTIIKLSRDHYYILVHVYAYIHVHVCDVFQLKTTEVFRDILFYKLKIHSSSIL